MSDIPVGSPPVPPGRHAAPSGWYADPVDPARERYWDGWQWSRNTRVRDGLPPAAGAAPAGPGYAPAPPPGPQYPGYPPAYPQQPGPPPAGYGYGQAPGLRRPTTADGVPLAGWWWRVLATVIDAMITSTVVGIIGFPLFRAVADAFSAYLEALMAAQPGSVPPTFDPLQVIGFQGILILTLLDAGVRMLYQVSFLRWRSATLGKMACGLRVVPVDQGRFTGPLGWNTIGIRAGVWVMPNAGSALPFLGIALSLFNLVDALFPLWQPKRQAIHDLAAKTQVVRIR